MLLLATVAMSFVACTPEIPEGPADESSTPSAEETPVTPPEESLPEAPVIPEATADAKIAEGGKTSFKLVRAEMAKYY